MKNLKICITLSILVIATLLFACGSEDDPYKSSRPVNDIDENSDYGNWPAPGPAGGGTGGTGNPTGPDGDSPSVNSTPLKNLEPQQVQTLCDTVDEKYKTHDDASLPEGRGACFDFAARRANQLGIEFPEQLQICEEEYLECFNFSHQETPTGSCLNAIAITTCEATVEELDRCTTQDAQILTNYFSKLNNRSCAESVTDDGIAQLDALLDNYPQPRECISLLEKCPNIFD